MSGKIYGSLAVGRMLKDIRRQYAIGQADLAMASKLRLPFVSELENGWTPLTPEAQASLARGYMAFGVDFLKEISEREAFQ